MPIVRPRINEERIDEILEIATQVFLEQGFSAASTNEIARLANTSKATFYTRFPTKEQLFLAVIDRRFNSIFRGVGVSLREDTPLRETLMEFGAQLLRVAFSADQTALLRVVSMEVPRFPSLGRRFYELGPKRGLETLAAFFQKQVAQGRLINDDSQRMAQHFTSLITGGPARWLVLGIPLPDDAKQQYEELEAAVNVFLRAYEGSGERGLSTSPCEHPSSAS